MKLACYLYKKILFFQGSSKQKRRKSSLTFHKTTAMRMLHIFFFSLMPVKTFQTPRAFIVVVIIIVDVCKKNFFSSLFVLLFLFLTQTVFLKKIANCIFWCLSFPFFFFVWNFLMHFDVVVMNYSRIFLLLLLLYIIVGINTLIYFNYYFF